MAAVRSTGDQRFTIDSRHRVYDAGAMSTDSTTIIQPTFCRQPSHITYMRILQPLLALSMLALRAGAQQTVQSAEFDVASIKPNKSNSTRSGVNHNGGLWRAENNTVKSLIISAYEVLPEQIVGAPSWVDADRFDIEAKYEKDPALSSKQDDQLTHLRIRALLENRFQIKIHREPKEWQAYVLVPGKKGPKLTPTERKDNGSSSRQNNGHWECEGVNMDTFARSIAFRLGRPVANETGLDGRFDFTLDFEPEGQVRLGDKDNPISGVEAKGPSLFSAIQDQLGLKLESRKVPVDMLVVDRIERPSEN